MILRLSRQLAIVIKHSFMVLLSLSIFTAGTVIFLSRIPLWSLFLGLIMIPIGFVLMVFSMDETARKIFVPENYKLAKCSVCGRVTYAKEKEKKVICGFCREKEIEELLKQHSQGEN